MANQILSRTAPATGVEHHADQRHAALKKRWQGAWGWRLAAGVFVVCGGVTLAAQDRVILFESSRWSGTSTLPGEIREIEIRQGGREWSTVRIVPLPAHWATARIVPLADGSRVVWLAANALRSAVLVQYKLATARASVIDGRSFELNAILVADPLALRVFVVETGRITALDALLRPEAMPLPDPKRLIAAYSANGYLFVLRYDAARIHQPAELVVVDITRREVVRILPLGEGGPYNRVRISRDGQNVFQYSPNADYIFTGQVRMDRISVSTGQVVARTTVRAEGLFELDDRRGLLIHGEFFSRFRIVVRRQDTLESIGELAPGVWASRRDMRLAQTFRDGTILVYSEGGGPYWGNIPPCAGPRIDVFDETTYAVVNSIDLQGHCSTVIPLPAR